MPSDHTHQGSLDFGRPDARPRLQPCKLAGAGLNEAEAAACWLEQSRTQISKNNLAFLYYNARLCGCRRAGVFLLSIETTSRPGHWQRLFRSFLSFASGRRVHGAVH
jgi:hypothetical protein